MIVRRARVLVVVVAFAVLAGTLLAASRPAAAHTHVTVAPYGFTVGWIAEPATANVMNGLDLGVNQTLSNGTVVPVLGAENHLAAVMMSGPASSTRGLLPQEDRPGWYTFPIIPTLAGSYSVRVQGSLGSTSINITVALDDVQAPSVVEFPVPNPTPADLQGKDNALSAQIASLQSQVALATGIAALAVAFGLAGIGVGAVLWRKGRRSS